MKFGSATSFNAANMKPGLSLGMLGVWATLLYAFSGAESASFMGDEIKDARRTVPRALIVAGAIITAGYILGTVAVLVALPTSQVNSMEGIMQAITSAAARVGWNGIGPAVALLICLANLGGVGAYLAALARIPFVVGIDRYLPPAFGRVHPEVGNAGGGAGHAGRVLHGLHPAGTGRQHGARSLPGAGHHDDHHQLRARTCSCSRR